MLHYNYYSFKVNSSSNFTFNLQVKLVLALFLITRFQLKVFHKKLFNKKWRNLLEIERRLYDLVLFKHLNLNGINVQIEFKLFKID